MPESPRIVNVLLALPVERTYPYSVPDGAEMPPVGSWVAAKAAGRKCIGVVWDAPLAAPYSPQGANKGAGTGVGVGATGAGATGAKAKPNRKPDKPVVMAPVEEVFPAPLLDKPMRDFLLWSALYTLIPVGSLLAATARVAEALKIPVQGAAEGGTGGTGGTEGGTGGLEATGGTESSTGGLGATGDAESGTGGLGATGDAESGTGGLEATGDAESSTGGTEATGGTESGTGGTEATRSTKGRKGKKSGQKSQQKKRRKTIEIPDVVQALGETPPLALSKPQAEAVASLQDKIKAQEFSVTLLEGVTGAGKSEVYLSALREALKAGGQVLVLLPEISLSDDWQRRLKQRLGFAPLVWHSSLTPAVRRETWHAAASGVAPLIVGARSALFLPLPRLATIIVDEEHDTAFKQEDGILYHARDLAVARGLHEQVAVVLVSATPSLESLVNAERGRYQRLRLPERHGVLRGASLPEVEAVDLRKFPPVFSVPDGAEAESKQKPESNTLDSNTPESNTLDSNTPESNTLDSNTVAKDTEAGDTETRNTETGNTETGNTETGNTGAGNTEATENKATEGEATKGKDTEAKATEDTENKATEAHKKKPSRRRKPAWLSPPLVAAMEETLTAGAQSLLFLNRRGYAPLMLCGRCGLRLQCRDCTAWLVLHEPKQRLHCHHCGRIEKLPPTCAACGFDGVSRPSDGEKPATTEVESASPPPLGPWRACGPGIERVAEEVRYRFPRARVAVASSDRVEFSDGTEGNLAEVFSRLADKRLDILIGTQIIGKGHHFAGLNLVGIVDADLGLQGGDLRALERSWQVLHQVAGRAGGLANGRAGRVLVQTRLPEHPVMEALLSGDSDSFLRRERDARKAAGMPPFGRLAAVILSSPNLNQLDEYAMRLRDVAPQQAGVQVLGPAPAPIAVLRRRHRCRFLVRAQSGVRLQDYMRHWLARATPPGSIRRTIDIDPHSFL